MTSEVDRQIARSAELLDRTRSRADAQRLRARRADTLARKLTRIAAVDAVILVAAVAIGWFVPLGIGGAMLVMALLVAATLLFALTPVERPVAIDRIAEVPLKALPLKTEQWLESQRPMLPAPAQSLIDLIGQRLDTLAPQLATIDENAPAAGEIRKLVAEQLPELVQGYGRVPPPLRNVERLGKTPDRQLVDGLSLIEQEIAEMTARLAAGDLDNLATRGRFLEIKYRGDGTGE